MCVIFNGAAHKGEAFAVVLRTVKNWQIVPKLVTVSLFAGSLKGRNISGNRHWSSRLQWVYHTHKFCALATTELLQI